MNTPISPLPTLDIVVPAYNEEAVIELFHQDLSAALAGLNYQIRIRYVNDGSSDGTAAALERIAAQDSRVSVVELSRNFGHQAALTAGMDLSDADVLISLDADGQHPPTLISDMLRLYESGYEIVLTQRLEQQQLPLFKRLTSRFFYQLINRMADTPMTPGAADFRLIARPAVEQLKTMREYHRFLRGMVAWMGFKTVILPFQPAERMAGVSKYSLSKMVRLAMNAIFSFSLAPLQFGLGMGLLFFVLAAIEVIYVLSLWILGQPNTLAPGWSSLMFMLLIVGGTLMILLSFIGIYIGYIFQEVKQRPIYIIRSGPAAAPQKEQP